ncbi:MAG: sugar transferase [Paracoccaceae bacterium]
MSYQAKAFTVAKAARSGQFEDRSFTTQSTNIYRDSFKRLFDIALVLLLAPIAVPLIAIFVLIIASTGASPFYSQRRIGKDGVVFDMLKIRTMVPNAKECLEAYLAMNPAAREEWDCKQKLQDDPRITPIGKILRKSSLDELPQLWNVLRGDMSIIGPRPMMEEQKSLYPGRAYYKMRPGITGPWQVSDRNATTFAARAQFDNDYYDNLTLASDVSILAKTVSVVLRCTGC